jgi:hypothetical protein
MTIPRHTILFLTLATTGLLLQGCGPRGPGGSGVRLYEADMKGGAKTCEVSKTAPVAGKTTDATMKVGSDGGWCGLYVQNGGRPFDAGLLTARAQHGTPFVHTVGTETRIDYTPDFGFAGADTFTIQLLPGDATLRVAVTAVAH